MEIYYCMYVVKFILLLCIILMCKIVTNCFLNRLEHKLFTSINEFIPQLESGIQMQFLQCKVFADYQTENSLWLTPHLRNISK